MMPPADPTAFVSKFAYSFLFGMGMMAGGRVRGFWKRMLLLAPALAALMIGEAIVPHVAGSRSFSTGAYICGVVCGIVLMISGFTPRRKQRASKL
jgi:hypothetical protein